LISKEGLLFFDFLHSCSSRFSILGSGIWIIEDSLHFSQFESKIFFSSSGFSFLISHFLFSLCIFFGLSSGCLGFFELVEVTLLFVNFTLDLCDLSIKLFSFTSI
jgi:hypothetical protein